MLVVYIKICVTFLLIPGSSSRYTCNFVNYRVSKNKHSIVNYIKWARINAPLIDRAELKTRCLFRPTLYHAMLAFRLDRNVYCVMCIHVHTNWYTSPGLGQRTIHKIVSIFWIFDNSMTWCWFSEQFHILKQTFTTH